MLTAIREWALMPEVFTVIITAIAFTAVVSIVDLFCEVFEEDGGQPPAILDQIDTAARWLDGRRKHWQRPR